VPETLWAPWRLQYIEKPNPSGGGCIFVELPAENDDRKNYILFRGAEAFVMLNAFPYTSGHLMIAPYQHTAELSDLSDAALLEINQLVAKAVGWLRAAYKPDGFNIGVNLGRSAGAGIPDHVHWHVVPRWSGDTNFMTTVGDARVLPQSLTDTWDRLRQIIQSEL
jgi:ATP adenylyltransferase